MGTSSGAGGGVSRGGRGGWDWRKYTSFFAEDNRRNAVEGEKVAWRCKVYAERSGSS